MTLSYHIIVPQFSKMILSNTISFLDVHIQGAKF